MKLKIIKMSPYSNYSKKICFFLLIFMVFAFQTFALDPEKSIRQYQVDQWNPYHGLPTESINVFAQTPDGYLWIGTDKGLLRFDGLEFEPLSWDHQNPGERTRIAALLVNKEGILWVGSANGLKKVQRCKLRPILADDAPSKIRISTIIEDVNRNLWVGTADNYLNRFEKGKWITYSPSEGLKGKFITSIIEDSKGFLWVATLINGLYKFQYGTFTKVAVKGLGSNHSIHALYEDRAGYLWLGTNMGVFRFKKEITQTFTTQDGLSDNRVNEILEDSDGNLWIGTVNGLNRIKESSSTEPVIESYFNNNYINCLFEDQEKSLWIGTNGSSIKRLRERVFTTYSTEYGLSNFISSLFQEKDHTIWAGTEYGSVYFFKNNYFKEFQIKKDHILDLRIRSIGEDQQGNVLVGTTRNGLFQIKDKHQNSYSVWASLRGTIIQSIYKDSKNHLWIGTMGKGLIHYHEGVLEYFTTGKGLLSNVVINCYEDKQGLMWVATSNGINCFANRDFSRSTPYLKGTFILSIYEDAGGIIWIGTLEKGLARCEGGEFHFITVQHGLGSNSIYQILEDEREYFWMSSNRGVLRVNKREVNDFCKGVIKGVNCIAYGIADGMNSITCNSWGRNSAIKTDSGDFWFATKKGISVVNPSKLKVEKLPPPSVIIEKVFVNGKYYEGFLNNPSFKQKDNIQIQYTATTFIALDRVKFKYQIKRGNEVWDISETVGSRQVTYSDLPVGEYTFWVNGCNSDGMWNKEGTSISFSIIPNFPKRVILGIIIFTALLGVTGYLLRKRVFHAKKKKYKSSSLDPERAEEYLKKLIYLMEYEKAYRDEKVSLMSLSKKLSISYHLLSQIINERMNRSFYDLINSYRIEEAKKRIVDPKEEKQSILTIAYDVGFNTKAAFNRVFKKYTKMTPTEYKKKFKK
jgi:ligand-binding sensor domain-containing protein/AraC-like DNA-binding protein